MKLHKIHCSRFLCTLCTVTVENSIVLLLFYLCKLRYCSSAKEIGQYMFVLAAGSRYSSTYYK